MYCRRYHIHRVMLTSFFVRLGALSNKARAGRRTTRGQLSPRLNIEELRNTWERRLLYSSR